MAEGPLVHHYANRLRRVLKGKEIRVEFGIRKLKPFKPSLEASVSRTLKPMESSSGSIFPTIGCSSSTS